MKGIKKNFLITVLLLLAAVTLYLFYNMGSNWEFALRLRGVKVAAIIVVSCCVAYSSVAFQTLTNNRILTPSIMGFESVYLLIQTLIVFMYGDLTFQVLSGWGNFLLSVLGMIGFAFLLYILIYKKGKDNLYLLLLVGIILGTLFNSLSSFMQLLIDPSDYFIVQGKMFATFNKINRDLLWPSAGVLAVLLVVGFRTAKYLDVLALGRDQAINLGLNYNRMVQLFLVIIAILVSVSTALVGPITFLGLLVTNLTYELFKTHRHDVVIAACCLVTAVTLLSGQFVMERLFHLSIPVSAIINLVGGLYFMFLLLRVRKL
ncbi:iron chelate uptake ABC transporter family permease subunit [Proteiniphilum sp.]|jgi:iron complex transport system permease protein|uniref:iron chelate uptake ABC transporter family permease subunit n=1 Tax=Proteiniphilum sp. TaxID=1926877 RepID=UPI0009258585|nr:iron chelate uptake ABC transporter family permease subunit [Proteiniphilum sp.]MEA5128427.1 iron chelate uptake ABC transporter family permease subunit [Proteiniphilum sp.]OJV90772.1 MAG: iron ABC transporter permease [Bacteroidia bacterium 44-10]